MYDGVRAGNAGLEGRAVAAPVAGGGGFGVGLGCSATVLLLMPLGRRGRLGGERLLLGGSGGSSVSPHAGARITFLVPTEPDVPDVDVVVVMPDAEDAMDSNDAFRSGCGRDCVEGWRGGSAGAGCVDFRRGNGGGCFCAFVCVSWFCCTGSVCGEVPSRLSVGLVAEFPATVTS